MLKLVIGKLKQSLTLQALKIDTCIAMGASTILLMSAFANDGQYLRALAILFSLSVIHFFVCYLYLLYTDSRVLYEFNPFDWRK